jgi:hypothetical protein
LNYEIFQSIFQSKTLDQSSKKLFVQTFLDIKKEKKQNQKKKKQERDMHVHNVGRDIKHMTPLDEWIRSDLPIINIVMRVMLYYILYEYFIIILLS